MKFQIFGKEICFSITDVAKPEPVIEKPYMAADSALKPHEILIAGDKVRVNNHSGFHKGAKGVVVFVEPLAEIYRRGQVWVLREGASTPVWFFVYELDKVYEG